MRRNLNRLDIARHIDDVRALTDARTRPSMAPGIAASWRRSLEHHRIDLEKDDAPTVLTEGELKNFREPLANLIELAGPALDQLYSFVRDIDYVVLLTDADGVAVEHRGNDAEAAQFRYWGLWRGAIWSERVEGTNGIGTCISELRPLTVHRDQHFRGRHINLSCCGAPIFAPDGGLAAILDVSSMNPEVADAAHALALPMVVHAARGIERRLFRERFRGHRILRLARDSGGPVLLIALDNDLHIAGADRAAREILQVADEDLARGVPAASHFIGTPRLFAKARSADASVSLTAVSDGAVWSAIVTPASGQPRTSVRPFLPDPRPGP